jgi:uncharacterized membrane protein
MRRYHVWIIIATIFVLAGVIGYFEFASGVRVTVRNTGQNRLRDVKVHVTGGSYSLGDLAPGGFQTRRVSSTSKSHVEVEFTDGQSSIRLDAGGYFNQGYRGTIDIDIRNGKIATVKHDVRASY